MLRLIVILELREVLKILVN